MISRKLELLIIILLFFLLCAGVYVGLRNLSYFNVTDIEITITGPVSSVNSDIERVINPLRGMNILEISTKALKKKLSSFSGVESVEVKRYYPNKLMITLHYFSYNLKAFCQEDDGSFSYFVTYDGKLVSATEQTWKDFDSLPVVELNPAYAQMILKWGSDTGFLQMIPLVEHLSSNNLITNIKYDNNNGSDFGRLVLWLPSCNSQLYVRELVSVQRLDEALAVIKDQSTASGNVVIFDLYANTLVKRT